MEFKKSTARKDLEDLIAKKDGTVIPPHVTVQKKQNINATSGAIPFNFFGRFPGPG